MDAVGGRKALRYSIHAVLIATAVVALLATFARACPDVATVVATVLLVTLGPVMFFFALLFRASHVTRLCWPWRLSLAWLEATLLLTLIAGAIGAAVDAIASPSHLRGFPERVSYAGRIAIAYGLYSFSLAGFCAAVTSLPLLAIRFFGRRTKPSITPPGESPRPQR